VISKVGPPVLLPGLATTVVPSLKVPTFPGPYVVWISFTFDGFKLSKSSSAFSKPPDFSKFLAFPALFVVSVAPSSISSIVLVPESPLALRLTPYNFCTFFSVLLEKMVNQVCVSVDSILAQSVQEQQPLLLWFPVIASRFRYIFSICRV